MDNIYTPLVEPERAKFLRRVLQHIVEHDFFNAIRMPLEHELTRNDFNSHDSKIICMDRNCFRCNLTRGGVEV